MELADRVAVVTGAASPLGAAVARRLAREGARLVLADGDAAALAPIAEAAGAGGGPALALGVDLAREADAQALMARAVERFGRLDVLVNGALASGAGAAGPAAAWERALATTLTGCYRCCRAAAPHMDPRRAGRIVNITSSVGRYRSSYLRLAADEDTRAPGAASSGGVLALTRQLALELAPRGIAVNAVVVGWISGDPTAPGDWARLPASVQRDVLAEISLGRLGRPDEVAAVVAFLASGASSYLSGTAIDVNGGWWMS